MQAVSEYPFFQHTGTIFFTYNLNIDLYEQVKILQYYKRKKSLEMTFIFCLITKHETVSVVNSHEK